MEKFCIKYRFLTEKADIILLNMPIAEVAYPSLALGILKSILQKADYDVSVIYANLLFAEKIGFNRWHRILSGFY